MAETIAPLAAELPGRRTRFPDAFYGQAVVPAIAGQALVVSKASANPQIVFKRNRCRAADKIPHNTTRVEFGRQPFSVNNFAQGTDPELMTEFTDVAGNDGWAYVKDGVEYRTTTHNGRTLVPIVNFNKKPRIVRLAIKGKAVDLLTSTPVDLARLALAPMEPKLLAIQP